jgi:hypothetical protein
MRTMPACLLLLAACGGADRVTVEGLAPFEVASEAWTSEADADGQIQSLVLTNVEGYCDKAQAANAAFTETVPYDIDSETYCADAMAPMQAWATAMAALWYDGAHYLVLQPSGDGGPADVAEGDWGGESTASALTGSLTYVDQDAYATYLEDWDEAGEGIDRCGVKSRNELGPLPIRDLETGLLTVESVEPTVRATGQVEGTFAALDGEDAPVTVAATFDAAWCAVDE